jgi:hypothetical protein
MKSLHKQTGRVQRTKRINVLVKDWRAQADFIESCNLGKEETGIVKAMRACSDELEQLRLA